MKKKRPYMFNPLPNVRMKWLLSAVFFISLVSFSIFSPFIGQGNKVSAYSVEDTRYDIKQYAIYAGLIACVKNSPMGISLKDSSDANATFRFSGLKASVGYITDGDVGNQDCSAIYTTWANMLGYTSNEEFFKAMDWVQKTVTYCGQAVIPSDGSCTGQKTVITTWEPKNGVDLKTDLLKKITSLTDASGIPTSAPLGTRYLEAYTALTDVCKASLADASTGLPVLGNDGVSVSYKTVTLPNNTETKTMQVYPYPGFSGGTLGTGWTHCDRLVDDATKAFVEIQSQIQKDMIASGTDIYANGDGETAGFCAGKSKVQTAVQKADGDPSDYTACRNAIAKCLQPQGSKLFIDFTADSLAKCFAAATGMSTSEALKKVKALQSSANAAALGSSASTNPCASYPEGNDIDGKPCSNLSTNSSNDPCALLPADTGMRWLACSLLTIGTSLTSMFYNAINSLLTTPADDIFDNKDFRTAISVFRNIGMTLIVIAGLVMIIAQSTGAGFVDAYTIRKVLPKLVFALVGVALAFPLLRFAVELTNDLGNLAGSLLTALAETNPVSADKGIGDYISLITVGGLGTAAAAGYVIFLGWGILALIGTVLLALLIGFAVLALRQLVIVVLILLAPLAIASFVLPGTEKLWKFWKTTLTTTLLMFPIIMLFLASGKFLASIFGKMGGNANTNALMAVIVYFAPYFMLPFAFKLAGGLMSTIFQIANDKNKGAFDRLRNLRANASKSNLAKMKEGNRFRDKGGASSRLNSMLQTATNLDKIDKFSPNYGSQMKSWKNADDLRKAAKAAKENEFFEAFGQDDTVLKAASYQSLPDIMNALADGDFARFGGDTKAAVEARQSTAAMIMRARQTMGSGVFEKARVLSKPGTGTAYNDKRTVTRRNPTTGLDESYEESYTDYAQALDEVNTAFSEDAVGWQTAVVNTRSGFGNSGHGVGAVSVGNWLAAANMKKAGFDNATINKFLHESLSKDGAPGQGVQGKPYAARENARGEVTRLQRMLEAKAAGASTFDDGFRLTERGLETVTSKVDDDAIQYEFAKAAANLDMLGSSPGEAGNLYATELQGAEVMFEGEKMSVRDVFSRMERNPEKYKAFTRRKKSYASGSDAAGGSLGVGETKPPEPKPEG